MTGNSLSKFRVCHIAATADGATWMVEQLRQLRDQKGYDVSAIIGTGSGALADKLHNEGIPFQRFDFEFPSSSWGTLIRRVAQLSAILRRERYDIVQTHLFASMVLGRLASWIADVPVRLAMVAGPYHLEAHTPRWIDSSTFWMETGLIASCEYTRSLYLEMGAPPERVALIYYGPDEAKFDRRRSSSIDLRRDLSLPKSSKLVGMVAYFYPRLPVSSWTPEILHDRANKRQEDLINAAPAILAEFPQARIVFIGSGWGEAGESEMAHARSLVAALSLEEAVLFTGYRDDVNSILMSLDVAVQASLSENLGGTIESLLMQCPTVATRTGGLVDSVRDGETGVLVEPLNPSDLAQGVLRILRDPVRAQELGANGRALMLDRFTLKRTITDLDELYREQIGRQGAGYGTVISSFRTTLAVPIFLYLAAHLAWDIKIAPTLKVFMGRATSGLGRASSRLTTLLSGAPSLDTSLAESQPDSHEISQEKLSKRFADRGYLQCLYAYGYCRYLLRNTTLLQKWDRFFGWIRGRT